MKIISTTRFCTTLSFLSLFVSASFVMGAPIPANLGSGLDVLVRERLAKRGGVAKIDSALAQAAQSYRDIAISNKTGQIKVYIHLAPKDKGAAPFALPSSAVVTATDMTYRSGVIEAFVNLDDVSAIARNKAVKSVVLAIQPILDVGVATSQGVVQHRVDQIPGSDGTGVTVGLMSDSFDTSASGTDGYLVDQGTGDLPGPSNTAGNLTPVQVLDDPLSPATDEGRAMAQIVHDMAPKARLGFATASAGQVSFADNIRSLAGLATGSHMVPGFAARVIVDDLFYSDSPMFGTSLVGRAVNEVAGAPTNVSYFSSAGNRASNQGYFSNYRNVSSASLATALAGTNIPVSSFSTIPAASYAGGFHNFRTDGGQDIAQLISNGLSGTGNISFQWDDPFDVDPPTFNPVPFFTSSGSIPGTTNFVLTGLTAGAQYRVAVTDPSDAADVEVDILDPSSNLIIHQDTGFNEVLYFFAPVSGNYTVRVKEFAGAAASPYDVNAYVASGTGRITVDYNLFFFNATTGAFIRSIAANNFASNQPLEIGSMGTFPAGGMMQVIVARANTPVAPVPATKIRYVMTGVCQPLEYFDYQTPITYGHNHEPGAISVAAYNPWRPFLPEDFTSPGPSYIYFDQNANRLATPIIRQKPDVAALDGGNNSFFSSDDSRDTEVPPQPNFFGTSAAAPHAAAIAALVLQAHGGAVTQPQMRTILQRAGFMHDLDPFYSVGIARAGSQKITITARGNAGNFNNSDTRSLNVDDTKTFGVSYVGSGSVATLSLNLQTANPNGGDVVASSPGLVWDNRALTPRTANSGFAFTVGQVTGTFVAGNVTSATYSNPAPLPAVAGQNFKLDLTFAANTLIAGNSFTFGADRDEAHSAFTPPAGTAAYGNSADLLGAAVSIPQGTITPGGATLTGTFGDATAFTGTFTNVIGKGYSTLDGYGFINAQDAVTQPLP